MIVPELVVLPQEEGRRLDAYLTEHVPGTSRNAVQRMIGEGCVSVVGANVRASYRLHEGDIIHYSIPEIKPTDILPEDLPIDVVFEDEDLIVVNKPRGMVVHPAPGSPAGTLVNALLAHCRGLSSVGGVERPGIVHRLDKDTSGLMVIAKNDESHRGLQKQIQTKSASRKYLVLVWGNPKFVDAVVDAPIGRHPTDRKRMAVITSPELKARKAVTDLHVVERFGAFSLIEASLQTGRTHQVRVHTAYAGHPVVGDSVYSGNRRLRSGGVGFVTEVNRLINGVGGQALHAYNLSFNHPRTGERCEFSAPLPPKMDALVEYLRENCSG